MWQIWEFAFRGGWNDADGKSKHLCFSKFLKMSKNGVDEKCDKIWTFIFENGYIADEKSEYLLFEMSGNVADKKCKNLFLK